MNKISKTLLLLAGCASINAYGAWVIVEDFEDADLSNWTEANSYDPVAEPNRVPGSISSVVAPFGSGNVGAAFPGDQTGLQNNFRAWVDFPTPITNADDGSIVTVYCKFGIPEIIVDENTTRPGKVDMVWGISPADPNSVDNVTPFDHEPAAYGDYATLARISGDQVYDARDDVQGGSYIPLTTATTDTWYEQWQVIDAFNWTYRTYVKGGIWASQTNVYPTEDVRLHATDDKPGTDRAGALFRARSLTGDIYNWLLTSSTGNTATPKGQDSTYFDDIAIDMDGKNLTSPGGDSGTGALSAYPRDGDWVNVSDQFGLVFQSGDWFYSQELDNWGSIRTNVDPLDDLEGVWVFVERFRGD